MKKIILSILSLVTMSSFGQVLITDYENGDNGTLFSFDFGLDVDRDLDTDGQTQRNFNEDNPNILAPNTSAQVRQLNVKNGDDLFANYQGAPKTIINTDDNGTFKSFLFRATKNDIPVRIQLTDGTIAHNNKEGQVNYTGNGNWQLLRIKPIN